MRALVTGGTGFIGGHLCERLVREGVEVRALVRPTSDTTYVPVEVERVTGDLEDPTALDGLLDDRDVVFHLAAARGAGGEGHSGRRETDIRGTVRLAERAADHGARFVFASSRGVHGAPQSMLDSETPLTPNTRYRRLKAEAERELARVAGERGLKRVVMRVPSVVGARGRGWLGLYRAIAGGSFRLIGSGRNRLHPCPVEDVVEALLLAGVTPHADGKTFIFSGGEVLTLRDYVTRIADCLGVSISRFWLPATPYRLARGLGLLGRQGANGLSPYEMFLTSYEIDNDLAHRGLGYEPRAKLDDALRATADWYRSEGLL